MNKIYNFIIAWTIIIGLPSALIGACLIAENIFVNGINVLIGMALIVMGAIFFALMLVLQEKGE